MKLYKFTDRHYMTRNNTWWGEGVTHKLRRKTHPCLCTEDVIHAYKNIDLAYIFCLNHGWNNFTDNVLWECEGKVVIETYDKVGCFKLTTVKQLIPPLWSCNKDKYTKVVIWFYLICIREALKFIPSNTEYYDDTYKAYNLICKNLYNDNFDFYPLHNIIVKNVLLDYNIKANIDPNLYYIHSLLRDIIHMRQKFSTFAYVSQDILKGKMFTFEKLIDFVEEAKEKSNE